MGSSVKSATNAIGDAARDVRNEAQRVYRRGVGDNMRAEIGSVTDFGQQVTAGIRKRPLENVVSIATLGAPALVREAGKAVAPAIGLGPDEPAASEPVPVPVSDPYESVYPTMKRKRQVAGRGGTILAGGGGTVEQLGGTSGRSTLLGL